MEKLTLMYFFRAPPKYAKDLTCRAFRLMWKGPLLGMMFGVWVLGNPAMFN